MFQNDRCSILTKPKDCYKRRGSCVWDTEEGRCKKKSIFNCGKPRTAASRKQEQILKQERLNEIKDRHEQEQCKGLDKDVCNHNNDCIWEFNNDNYSGCSQIRTIVENTLKKNKLLSSHDEQEIQDLMNVVRSTKHMAADEGCGKQCNTNIDCNKAFPRCLSSSILGRCLPKDYPYLYTDKESALSFCQDTDITGIGCGKGCRNVDDCIDTKVFTECVSQPSRCLPKNWPESLNPDTETVLNKCSQNLNDLQNDMSNYTYDRAFNKSPDCYLPNNVVVQEENRGGGVGRTLVNNYGYAMTNINTGLSNLVKMANKDLNPCQACSKPKSIFDIFSRS